MNTENLKSILCNITGKNDELKNKKFNSLLKIINDKFQSNIKNCTENPSATENIIKIYELYFKYIMSIQARRWKQHSFYFALYSFLLYAISTLHQTSDTKNHVMQVFIGFFLMSISYIWLINLQHIQRELHIKYAFMQSMEEFLPVSLFKYEFESIEVSELKVNSNYEIVFIKIFLFISILVFITSIITLALKI